MAAKREREEEFVVSDRRRFSDEGQRASDDAVREPAEPQRVATLDPESGQIAAEEQGAAPLQTPPSSAEQQQQHDAYNASNRQLEQPIAQATGRAAAEFEMTFERLVVSLYMTAMMQLGLLHEQGQQPMQPDIIGARQTIDTLSLLQDKTENNLTDAEQQLLQNSLYELRMAYVELTNALTRPPAPGAAPGGVAMR